MNTSFREYMRPGIILHMAYDGLSTGTGPVLECLSHIAEDDYFDAVEITHIEDDETRKKAAGMIRVSHMAVAYGGQPCLLTTGMNLNHPDPEERKKAVDRMKAAIDEAYEIGAEGFSFLAGKYEEEKADEAFEYLLESTRQICAYAAQKGDMPVLCEVFDYDIDKKSLIGPVDRAKKYAEIMTKEYRNFGLLVDSSHIPMLHETFEEDLIPVKKYIRHAHMGNTVIASPELPAYGDQHPRFGFPNSENNVEELAHYLQVLLDIGFLNKEHPPIVSFEVKPYGDEKSEFVIANAKRTLNAAWKLVEEKKLI